MLKIIINQIKAHRNIFVWIADFLLIYSILTPVMLNLIREYVELASFVFKGIILLGPGLISVAIYLARYGVKSIQKNKLVILVACWLTVVLFLTSINNIEAIAIRDSINHFISDCLFGFLIGMLSKLSLSRSKRLFALWLPYIILFIIYAFYYKYNQKDLLLISNLLAANSARVGALFFFFFFCSFGYYQAAKGFLLRSILIFISCASIWGGFYGGSKSAFLVFLIMGILYFFFQIKVNHKNKYHLKIAYPGVIVLILIFSLLIFKPAKISIDNVKNPAKQIKAYIFENDHNSYKAINRLRIWNSALDQFKQNPILGAGYRATYHDEIADTDWNHPHNVFLQFLAETGLLGFGIFLLFLFLVIRKAIDNYRRIVDDEDKLTYIIYPISFVYFLLFACFHFAIHENYFLWYFAGMIVGFDSRPNSSEAVCKHKLDTDYADGHGLSLNL